MFVVRRRGSRDIDRLQHEMEDLFQSMLTVGRPVRVRIVQGDMPAWRPAVEVYETADRLVVIVELAGMREEDIEVVIDDSVMTIRGQRTPAACEERRTIHAMGIAYGPFAADVFLPFSIDHERVEAAYESGLLRIELPRSAATRIAIGEP